MIHRQSPSNTIANAPEVPSSNQMPYFDPRNTSYYPTSSQPPPASAVVGLYTFDMNSAATAAGPVVDVNNSLPPLSHLLPSKVKQDTADYFSPQARQTATVPSHTTPQQQQQQQQQEQQQLDQQQQQQHPQHQHYRKSVDFGRNMYPPPPPDRRYIAGESGEDNAFYMLPGTYPSISSSNGDMSSMYSMPPQPYRNHMNGQRYPLPSPPTSVIDGVLVANHHQNNQHVVNGGITNNSQKVFSFVPLPGLNQKKRPRRKFHEVERLYQCNYEDCTKSYGTLNHLNAHVSMQRHGHKRQPTEFKELRKMWRKQKRDNKQRSGSRSTSHSLEEESEMVMSSNNSVLSHHHEYMPPYMQHPSLLSHPPPPTLWRPHYQPSTGFMPPPPPPGY